MSKQYSIWETPISLQQAQPNGDEDDQDTVHRHNSYFFKFCCCAKPCLNGCLLGGLIMGIAFATLSTLYLLPKPTTKYTNNYYYSTSSGSSSLLSTTNSVTTTTQATTLNSVATTTQATTLATTMNSVTTTTAVSISLTCPATAAFTGVSTLETLGGPTMSWTCFGFNWTASATTHTINFQFRLDCCNWSLDDVSILDTSANQLILNGGFETTASGNANGRPNAANWAFSNNGCGCCSGIWNTQKKSGSYSWGDGCAGSTDKLSQSFSTIIGNTYFISWWLMSDGGSPGSFYASIS